MRFQICCLWNWSSMCIQACTGERFNGCQALFAHKKLRISVQMKLTNGSFCFKQLMLHGKEIFLLRFLYLYSCLISSFFLFDQYYKKCMRLFQILNSLTCYPVIIYYQKSFISKKKLVPSNYRNYITWNTNYKDLYLL